MGKKEGGGGEKRDPLLQIKEFNTWFSNVWEGGGCGWISKRVLKSLREGGKGSVNC